MKSYTDLEQSKKLAKILPLKSADMFYWEWKRDTKNISIANVGTADESDLPCWSLAALISVLPQFIEFRGHKYYLRFMKECVEYANEAISIPGRCLYTTSNDNLVDACYKMIIKLHEQKLL